MEQFNQLPWYFYLLFASLAIYSWIAGFAYIYEEKGKKGLIKAGILFLVNLIVAVAMYRYNSIKGKSDSNFDILDERLFKPDPTNTLITLVSYVQNVPGVNGNSGDIIEASQSQRVVYKTHLVITR